LVVQAADGEAVMKQAGAKVTIGKSITAKRKEAAPTGAATLR